MHDHGQGQLTSVYRSTGMITDSRSASRRTPRCRIAAGHSAVIVVWAASTVQTRGTELHLRPTNAVVIIFALVKDRALRDLCLLPNPVHTVEMLELCCLGDSPE